MDGLAHRIRHARRNANLSQKQLARKLKLSEMAVSAYETGRAIPPLPTLGKISRVTGFPLGYFTDEKHDTISLESINRDIKRIKHNIAGILKILRSKHE
ncbi:MAG: helix-turn-helix transcriptional regulator [Patescibacteria group bacterium]